jgi:acyl-CoA synthetase (NDP forming)
MGDDQRQRAGGRGSEGEGERQRAGGRGSEGEGDVLRALLSPDSVAIVGLSADPAKHGNRVLRNLRRLGYGGRIWGVNPRRTVIDGIETVPTVSALPERPDVLVCAVPSAALPEVFGDAGDRGADAAIVFGGGFAETGAAGRRAQGQLVAMARRAGVRLLGPNSGGVVHAGGGVALSFLTWLDRPIEQVRGGPVALVTQSGGMGSYIHSLAAARGGGLAVSISTGNEADVGVAEVIAGLAVREDVHAIALILETVRDGPAFMAAVRSAHGAGKPVIACRLGTSDHGRQLMRSHTGALAGPTRVLDGVCDALGVTLVETPGELLDVAEMMAGARVPTGGRVGVVTHSGGTAILVSDLATRHGLSLPAPPPPLATCLAPLLDHGSAANPTDLGAIIGGPHRFAEVVEQFLDSDAYDVVLAVTTPHPPAHTAQRARGLLATGRSPVPLLHLWMAGDLGAEGLALLRRGGAPVVEDPRAAVRALAGLVGLHQLACDGFVPSACTDDLRVDVDDGAEDFGAARVRVSVSGPAGGDDTEHQAASEHQAKAVLQRWGIPVVRGGMAHTADHAVAVAERLGYPVVVKISSAAILHKTEVDGIRVGLRSAEDVAAAFDGVVAGAATAVPDAAIDGVLVEQFRPGLEMVVGMVVDETFGPVALVGVGGIDAEARADVAVAPAPVTVAGARRLVSRLRADLTSGGRTYEPPDLDALAAIVHRLSAYFRAHDGRIIELEINPLTWGPHGWQAVDALLRRAPSAGP